WRWAPAACWGRPALCRRRWSRRSSPQGPRPSRRRSRMEPELAVALPAAGAACATALRPRPRLALSLGALLGAGGLAAVVLSAPGAASDLLGITLSLSAPSRSMLIVAAAALAFVVVLAPQNAERSSLLRWGLAGLAGMAAIAVAPTLDVSVMVLLALVVLQAAVPGRRASARRLRAPALAVALLGLGLLFARMPGPPALERLGAVGLVAGLVAALGALPYMHEFDPEELTATSPIPWLAFVGPLLAVVVLTRARDLVPTAAGALGAMLIGLGLLNIVWGCISSWRTELGAAALAGSAPFAGFTARILLLRGATALYWPLALVLAATLLLWVPSSLRLGRTLGMPNGRQLAGVVVALALNVALGLYPQPLLSL